MRARGVGQRNPERDSQPKPSGEAIDGATSDGPGALPKRIVTLRRPGSASLVGQEGTEDRTGDCSEQVTDTLACSRSNSK